MFGGSRPSSSRLYGDGVANRRHDDQNPWGAVFHPLTHALIGWVIAGFGGADRPTRLWCLIASVASDVDGLSLLFGLDAYGHYHHALAHNLLFGSGVVLVAARWVGLRPWPLALVVAAFLSHLVGDYVGSGPGWGLWPFRPFSEQYFECRCAWDLVSWQNTAITGAALAAAGWLAVRRGYTPLEFVDAVLDRSVVLTLRLRTTGVPCHWCPLRAAERCQSCRRPACPAHLAGRRWLRPLCRDCGGRP